MQCGCSVRSKDHNLLYVLLRGCVGSGSTMINVGSRYILSHSDQQGTLVSDGVLLCIWDGTAERGHCDEVLRWMLVGMPVSVSLLKQLGDES